MKCPKCNADNQARTLSTRSREWGMKRVKQCLKCGHRFATIEIYEITTEAMRSLSFSNKAINTKERIRNETR